MENTGENFLSTKFWLAVGIIVMAYALVWAGMLDPKTWLELATGISGIYAAGNVAQKFSK